ncbi:MAG: hypothetical protein M3619_32835, partial [Myxococcota bacterium]|nr:hypothetical protein [Myxococcota bacterium]
MTTLQFTPSAMAAVADPDLAVIPGAPKRAPDVGSDDASPMTDAEILAMVAAIDENEVLAAAEAAHKKVSPEVLAYAR